MCPALQAILGESAKSVAEDGQRVSIGGTYVCMEGTTKYMYRTEGIILIWGPYGFRTSILD